MNPDKITVMLPSWFDPAAGSSPKLKRRNKRKVNKGKKTKGVDNEVPAKRAKTKALNENKKPEARKRNVISSSSMSPISSITPAIIPQQKCKQPFSRRSLFPEPKGKKRRPKHPASALVLGPLPQDENKSSVAFGRQSASSRDNIRQRDMTTPSLASRPASMQLPKPKVLYREDQLKGTKRKQIAPCSARCATLTQLSKRLDDLEMYMDTLENSTPLTTAGTSSSSSGVARQLQLYHQPTTAVAASKAVEVHPPSIANKHTTSITSQISTSTSSNVLTAGGPMSNSLVNQQQPQAPAGPASRSGVYFGSTTGITSKTSTTSSTNGLTAGASLSNTVLNPQQQPALASVRPLATNPGSVASSSAIPTGITHQPVAAIANASRAPIVINGLNNRIDTPLYYKQISIGAVVIGEQVDETDMTHTVNINQFNHCLQTATNSCNLLVQLMTLVFSDEELVGKRFYSYMNPICWQEGKSLLSLKDKRFCALLCQVDKQYPGFIKLSQSKDRGYDMRKVVNGKCYRSEKKVQKNKQMAK